MISNIDAAGHLEATRRSLARWEEYLSQWESGRRAALPDRTEIVEQVTFFRSKVERLEKGMRAKPGPKPVHGPGRYERVGRYWCDACSMVTKCSPTCRKCSAQTLPLFVWRDK